MPFLPSLPSGPSAGAASSRQACAAAAGLALYSGEIERHWIEVTERDFFLRGLPCRL